ncbi:membrane attack complex component perforin complement C9 [Musa troglodytarum]|uniref:Membrane attack complex component perforin complement C9 n=1 Tax=Musa troglodytarum TaxID=320322 RepID=A0A9E7H0J3_9LILI|nr:membrane attack complex component perforin complement C9 [Musa troglodytarum]
MISGFTSDLNVLANHPAAFGLWPFKPSCHHRYARHGDHIDFVKRTASGLNESCSCDSCTLVLSREGKRIQLLEMSGYEQAHTMKKLL